MDSRTIHVSLTTVPSRFRYLHSTIDSLVHQTVQPTRIIINIPKRYSFRFAQSISERQIAALMARYDRGRVSINRVDHDYGPGTKLLGLLEGDSLDRFDAHAYLVLVDDDVIYDAGMIETFCDRIDRDQAQFASFRCYWIDGVPVGQGVDGFLIRAKLLGSYLDYYNIIKSEDYLLYHDDLYLSYFFFLQGIRLTFIDFKSYTFKPMGWIDALSSMTGQYSRSQVQARAIEILLELDRHGKFDFIKPRRATRTTSP